MNIEIKPLSAELLDSYLYFFDHVAFADNRDWEGCYCVFYHHQGNVDEWNARSISENRTMAAELIALNRLRGFLAFHDGKPVAWCNANEKEAYSLDKNRKEAGGGLRGDTISIVCFLVAPGCRKMGISTRLLKGVIEYYAPSDKAYIEAYPALDTTGEAANYHGPLAMYLKNGFYIDREYAKYSIDKYELKGKRALQESAAACSAGAAL